jgi:uncharacterized protein
LPEPNGSIDVDVSATPLTNILPIRRLWLRPGENEELAVAYVRIPELLVGAERRRYGCLETRAYGGLYRRASGRRRGLVLGYPELFRRAWSG